MAEDTRAQQQPVGATPEPAMPTGEQKIPEPAKVEPVAVEPQAPATTQPVEPSLPEDAKQRTKEEFEKLRQQSEKYRTDLIAEREKRFLNQPAFYPTNQGQVPEPPPVYDPATGLLNEKVFADTQRAAQEARVEAERNKAELEALKRQRGIDEDNRQFSEAISVLPELNYNDPATFNKDLHRQTRAYMTDSMIHPEDYSLKNGESLSYKNAGLLAKEKQTTEIEKAREEGAVQAVEQLTPKEQASLAATGTPGRRGEETSTEDEAELRYQTRKGSDEALIARLRKIPVVGQG